MKGKAFLLAGVAALAMVGLGTTASANSATASDTSADQSAAPTNYELEQRIEALEAEVQASEVRQADDRNTLSSSLSKLDGWWNNTSISGRMYFDLSYIDNKHDQLGGSTKDPANGIGFDIKRFYVGIDHKFDDVYSGNITTDVTYSGAAGDINVYVKKAYLQAKYDDAFTVRLGSADLPWIPYVEDQYGFRYVENTLIDRTKFGTSADWGVHVLGKFADGLISYQVSAVNGNGYKNPTRAKGLDFEGRLSLNYQGFQFAVGGYTGKLGAATGTTTHHTANRFDALAAYSADGLRVGVEYFTASNWKTGWANFVTTAPAVTDKADGWSGFASYQFDPQWNVFGRYDAVLPSKDYGASDRNTYYDVGVTYSPTKIVDLSLVYKHDSLNHGKLPDSNGTIGAVTGGFSSGYGSAFGGDYNEIGLFGQFRW